MSRLIGTRDFYKKTMLVAVPIMIQNGVTNFVGMLDNIMIGRVGADQMSGVAIVNQLLFVWYLCIFGGLAGIGIFTSQFYGKGDRDGIRYTVRLMLWTAVLLTAIGLLVFSTGADRLISLYLHEDASGADPAATFAFAKSYLRVMYFGFLPFALSQVYSSTLRCTGETLLPMTSGLLAVAVNLVGNYILIYGKLGFPALGVVGAAIATVISRVVEFAFVAVSAHRKTARFPFLSGVYRSLRIPRDLIKKCAVKGAPLLVNEAFWSGGQAALLAVYSLRGLSVIGAFNISQTINNVFNISFIAMGNAIAILIGQTLGAGKIKQAREDAGKYIAFSMAICLVVGAVMLPLASTFPRIYNTTEETRLIAAGLIRISAFCMPMYAFLNACYFILRSGGKTIITFFFDSVFCWVCSIPVAYLLVQFTSISVTTLYLSVQLVELLKCLLGFILVRKGVWARDITAYQAQ